MDFLCLLTWIYLDVAAQEIPDVDQFIQPLTRTDLGLIRDYANPISKVEKMGATMIREAYEAGGHKHDTTGFTDIGETPMDTDQSNPQTCTNVAGTFWTPTLPPNMEPHPFTFRPVPADYVLVCNCS